MRANPHAITVALDLHFKAVSLRKIVDHLKQFEHVNISHVAVLKWIQKYVADRLRWTGEEYGTRVRTISEACTSQTCPRCASKNTK